MSLAGKKVLCVGGNGYIGNYFVARLIQAQAQVSILCRSGPKYKYPENDQADWLIGSVFNPQKFEQQIKNADIIVHTVGTLIDTTIMGKQKPGGPGTYESMNRDALASILNAVKQKKQVFYLSAVGHPPFIHRYATTKEEAEEILLKSKHDGYIFKPGFVYNWEHRKWSIPLKYSIQVWNKVYPVLHKLTFNGTKLQKFVQEFQQSEPTSLQKMGDSLIQIINNGCDQRIIKNQKFNELSQQFRTSKISSKSE